ncbi:amino acid adenylation domain-containing protein [Scytonema sp. HK-05]|uniref:non-ribosomal peptide synthetase n=1 Tax=Scytonema sp. HK-05 TaxID=1137095 RepID=UPI0009376694|nr:non-ribosomal peptide synthetase [Scytonema sp. HK-05]OKH60990.1 non-ribosomal peptide synthetase [Scytonema sp. HK-05]BAY46373.1 amino acid adenylation domain-containing protein [Scytonema sp. HK-05]
MDDTSKKIAPVSPIKRELPELELQNKSADVKRQHTIPKKIRTESAPLSFAQQRLWFLAQLDTNNSPYHITKTLQLQGNLNVAVLQQSLDAIVAHHEALRTNFLAPDGKGVQVISEPRSLELQVIDLKDCPPNQRTTQIQQTLQHEAQRPFNLTSDLMLRGSLLVLSPQEHILLLVMHHIAGDRWSMSILFEQLATLYQAFLNAKPNPLPEQPIQYTDFAVWQRQWLSGEVLENQLKYWKQQLVGANPVLELPADRPRPPVQTYQGAKQSFVISESLSQALSKLSQQEGVTLYMTLLAAFQTQLYRYTGQQDILVGSPIAGRNLSELEYLIGFFVNTLVLRTDMAGNPSFRELLQRVRNVAMSAYAYQDLPIDKLIDELQPERSLSYHPLFQVMFVLQNTPPQTFELPGLTLTPYDWDNVTSRFDLTLSISETEQGLQGLWEYNTDLFDACTISRMSGHFQTLLEGIVANPEQHISELPLLTAAEHHQLLYEWNDTDADYPQDKCIHELFEQLVRTPDAVALMYEEQQLTYQELNALANQFAHYLKTLGVGPEVLVGIFVERSLEMVVGLLGILKAGGAYVPLDPTYPKERLAFMLQNSQPLVLLTQEFLITELPEHTAQVVCFDRDWHSITQHSEENLNQTATAANLAYVIYTSGSTGKPKAVQVTHANLCHYAQAMGRALGITAEDVYMHTASIAFSSSVRQLMVPLAAGATVKIATSEQRKDPRALFAGIKKYDVTVVDTIPSYWRNCIHTLGGLEQQTRQALLDNKLRLIVTTGEPLLSDIPPQWTFGFQHGAQLINMYGQTETSGTVAVYPIPAQQDERVKIVPLGRPIANTQIYLLDSHLQPVPIGVVGELHIGGGGPAGGYLNRPELTAEKFIPNPFSQEEGARLYKTGDLARYLQDGNIEFIGRSDYQVQIRGFRIELGEIEAVLSQHPFVLQTVVIAREDVRGDKRLVAYVVPNQEPAPIISDLRRFLREKLPEYMIPSAFVLLSALPLTPTGKVNRNTLPAPDLASDQEATFVAPRDELEQKLSQIWEEVLQLQPIGVKDNFFDIGGHSLIAVHLFAQIEQKFGKKLPLATLFTSGTVETLAQMLRSTEEKATDHHVLRGALGEDTSIDAWSSLVKIQPKGSKRPLFLVHPLGGEILCYRPLAMLLGPEQPIYGLQPRGLDGKQPPLTRVEDMAAHYIQAMQIIQRNGPYYIGGYSFGGIVALEIAQQLHSQGEKVAILAMIDTCVPGSEKRSPFLMRIFEHINNFRQQGPAYLQRKLVGWREWGTYQIREKYKRLLESERFPEGDKHLDIIGANDQAQSQYIFQLYPGQMTLLRTDDKNRDTGVGMQYDPLFGWGSLVAGGIDVHHLPGSHISLLDEPNVRVLAEKLKLCLEKAYVINSNQ